MRISSKISTSIHFIWNHYRSMKFHIEITKPEAAWNGGWMEVKICHNSNIEKWNVLMIKMIRCKSKHIFAIHQYDEQKPYSTSMLLLLLLFLFWIENIRQHSTFNIQWWRLFIIISHIYLLTLWIELIVHRLKIRLRSELSEEANERTCRVWRTSGWKFVSKLIE